MSPNRARRPATIAVSLLAITTPAFGAGYGV